MSIKKSMFLKFLMLSLAFVAITGCSQTLESNSSDSSGSSTSEITSSVPEFSFTVTNSSPTIYETMLVTVTPQNLEKTYTYELLVNRVSGPGRIIHSFFTTSTLDITSNFTGEKLFDFKSTDTGTEFTISIKIFSLDDNDTPLIEKNYTLTTQ